MAELLERLGTRPVALMGCPPLGGSRFQASSVGLYHTPLFGYLILGLGSQNLKVGYRKKGGRSLQVICSTPAKNDRPG